jgi:opacity protein-like surface antigen
MLSKKVLVLTAVMLLAIAGSSYAGTEAGMMELGLQGSYTQTKIDNEDFKFYLGFFNFGYFVTPQIEVGALGLFGGNINGETQRIYAGSADLRYNFSYNKAQTVVPYLGIQAGIAGTADGTSESAFAYGAVGGLKFFVTERTSLNAGLSYVRTKISDKDIDTFTGTVGLSFYFGK